MKQKHRRRTKGRRSPKAWIAAIAIVIAMLMIGDSNPQLRQTLRRVLIEVITGKPPRAEYAGAVRVIDGDTLDVAGTRVRLFGIDAPETGQTCRRDGQDWTCGLEATRALTVEIGGQGVTCEERDIDRYGRVVGICYARSRDLNAWMVRSGWAVAYRQYGGTLYDAEELAAVAKRRGIWSSDFVMPWDWRRGER